MVSSKFISSLPEDFQYLELETNWAPLTAKILNRFQEQGSLAWLTVQTSASWVMNFKEIVLLHPDYFSDSMVLVFIGDSSALGLKKAVERQIEELQSEDGDFPKSRIFVRSNSAQVIRQYVDQIFDTVGMYADTCVLVLCGIVDFLCIYSETK